MLLYILFADRSVRKNGTVEKLCGEVTSYRTVSAQNSLRRNGNMATMHRNR